MVDTEKLIRELQFKAVKSSGAGGQHVNKTASKVELQFDIEHSKVLDDEQKKLLYKKLKNRLTKDKILILQSEESRSQHKNKVLVIARFLELVKTGLKKSKPRKKTKVPKVVKLKRLRNKKQQSEKKANRKPPNIF